MKPAGCVTGEYALTVVFDDDARPDHVWVGASLDVSFARLRAATNGDDSYWYAIIKSSGANGLWISVERAA